MNNDSSNSTDELVDNNSTLEKGVQANDVENKYDELINLDTTEREQNSQDSEKQIYLEELRGKELLNKTLEPEKKESRRTGLRSDPSVEHVQLETVVKRNTTKVGIKSTMDVDKWSSIIPVCVGSKNVAEFINTCEIAIKEVPSLDIPLLLKIINSKLAGNALEACKYRETDTWESIKSILQGAFEHRVSERALTIGLSCARMAPGENVTKFASRIEEMYYKLCIASTAGLDEDEAKGVKRQNKKIAMMVFINGLPEHLQLRLKARNPETLEAAMQMARDEELEYDSKASIDKLQDNVELQNFNKDSGNNGGNDNTKRQNGGNNFNKNQGYRGNNGYNNMLIRGNNSYNRQNNNGYNNFNNNRGGYNLQGFNNNNQRNNSNANRNASGTGCYTCGKQNHFARDCWQSGQNGRLGQSGNRQQINNNNRANNNARVNNGNNSNSDRSLHCSYCNKLGHEIVNCYTKQRNEKNNANMAKNSEVRQPSGVRLVHEIFDPSTSQDV